MQNEWPRRIESDTRGVRGRVSILIPAYNAERWLARTLESALAQTWRDTEIIVVDDGSTDGVADLARQFAVRVERQDRRGANAARNRLLSLSTGEWVQFLDADDRLPPEKIERQIERTTRDVDVVVAPASVDGRSIWYAPPRDPWIAVMEIHAGCTSANLWRREAVLRVGGWDETLLSGHEYELMFRLLQGGSSFAHDDAPGSFQGTENPSSVSRADPAAAIVRHATLVSDMLDHLQRFAGLSLRRRERGASVLFRLAQRLRPHDAVAARTLLDHAFQRRPELMDDLRRRGPIYSRLLGRLGFDVAERYDRAAKPLRRLLALRPR